jgi:hypothetical protein
LPKFYEPDGSLRRYFATRYLIRSKPPRDLRVDLARGLALWMIFVNHAPDNAFRAITLQRVAVFDAADVFVFLAGYAAGLVYGRAMDRDGWSVAAGAVLRRACVVYAAHIMTLMVLAAVVGRFGTADHVDAMRLRPLVEAPLEALWQALLLRFQPTHADILPIYVVLLAGLALVLPLLRRPALLLPMLAATWAASWLPQTDLPTWPSGGWTLDPLAWQVLFLGGAVLGYVPPKGRAQSVGWNRWLFVACAVLLLSARPLYVLQHIPGLPDGLAHLVSGLPERNAAYKAFQHPLRLLSVLALFYVAGHLIPRDAGWLRRRRVAPFVLMGQHGLPVFCATIPASFLAQRFIEEAGGGWTVQIAVNGGGLALLFVVALTAGRLKVPRGPTTANDQASSG